MQFGATGRKQPNGQTPLKLNVFASFLQPDKLFVELEIVQTAIRILHHCRCHSQARSPGYPGEGFQSFTG
jgi:hypothetical protein